MEKEKTLSAPVAAKYDLVGINPCRASIVVKNNRIEVDFTTMSLEQADKLVADGCKYLQKKGTSAPSQAPFAVGK